jgi:mannose-6-phosphate isomerase
MKLLAAAEPLSLQVHPTSERARIRYAEQNAAGIPVDAPERSYQDPSHKPELIYALTRFEGMAGFRDVEKTSLHHPVFARLVRVAYEATSLDLTPGQAIFVTSGITTWPRRGTVWW